MPILNNNLFCCFKELTTQERRNCVEIWFDLNTVLMTANWFFESLFSTKLKNINFQNT